jgi:hypothetical protein
VLKSGEAQSKPEATAETEQTAILSGKPDASAPKVIELPSQLKETADQVLALEKIAIRDGEVSGELVNRSSQGSTEWICRSSIHGAGTTIFIRGAMIPGERNILRSKRRYLPANVFRSCISRRLLCRREKMAPST